MVGGLGVPVAVKLDLAVHAVRAPQTIGLLVFFVDLHGGLPPVRVQPVQERAHVVIVGVLSLVFFHLLRNRWTRSNAGPAPREAYLETDPHFELQFGILEKHVVLLGVNRVLLPVKLLIQVLSKVELKQMDLLEVLVSRFRGHLDLEGALLLLVLFSPQINLELRSLLHIFIRFFEKHLLVFLGLLRFVGRDALGHVLVVTSLDEAADPVLRLGLVGCPNHGPDRLQTNVEIVSLLNSLGRS